MSAAEQYAHWVLSPDNAHRTGQYIKLAAKRFLSDLKREDIYFDEAEGSRIINFGERYCCLWEDKWRGQPLEVMAWGRFAFQQMYGWFNKSTGLRRFKRVYIQIAKKNAKTTMAALAGTFHLCADLRIQTPKVFVGANNEEQAKLCVNITGKVIEQSPALFELVEDDTIRLFRYKENIINIVHHERDGFIKALSKETGDKTSKTSGGKHGINPSLGIVDEYGLAPDDNLLHTLQSAQAAREEPMILVITTAGFNLAGPCHAKLRKTGIAVLEGTMEDDSYLPLIYEIDPPEGGITTDWLIAHEEVWEQANPSIDVSVFRHFLRDELIAAKNEGGSKEVSVMTLNFNRWMDSPEVFISSDVWNTNAHGFHVEPGAECYGGLEVADDIILCLLFPGEKVALKMTYIVSEEAVKQNEIYQANKSLLKIDPGNVVDNDIATAWIIEEFQKYNLHSFCFFKPHEHNSIVQNLIKEGYQGNPVGQGVSAMASPTQEYEKLLRSGQVEHFNDPILRWMNSNCLAIRKEAGTRIEKNPKVLGIYSCLNAISQWKEVSANGGTEIGIVFI